MYVYMCNPTPSNLKPQREAGRAMEGAGGGRRATAAAPSQKTPSSRLRTPPPSATHWQAESRTKVRLLRV